MKTLTHATQPTKAPVRDEADLSQPRKMIAPCEERNCIWKGGHVVDDFDTAHLHYALSIKEPGFQVEVSKGSFEDSWHVWANLENEEGGTTSREAREFLRALEIAEDMAAVLNDQQKA